MMKPGEEFDIFPPGAKLAFFPPQSVLDLAPGYREKEMGTDMMVVGTSSSRASLECPSARRSRTMRWRSARISLLYSLDN